MNNKGADQSARMRRLVCAFVVRKPLRTGFVATRPIFACCSQCSVMLTADGGNRSSAIYSCADPEGGRGSGLLKNHKNIGFLSNTSPEPMKNHKATKPAFNVGCSLPSLTKKQKHQSWTPSDKTLWNCIC